MAYEVAASAEDEKEKRDASSSAAYVPTDERTGATSVDTASAAPEPSADATRPKPQSVLVPNARVTLLYRLVDGACPDSFESDAACVARPHEQVVLTDVLAAFANSRASITSSRSNTDDVISVRVCALLAVHEDCYASYIVHAYSACSL